MRVNRRMDHYARCLQRSRAAFIELRGEADAVAREAAIAALPSKIWRGTPVYEMTCEGPFGRGPHRQFIPGYVLWSLIDLRHFVCPFHR